ncbi:MAG: DsrE family protein, partial [Actinobacteria bacterium]|nr:DsrE family protein [Actinomycetota bacterium]
MKSLLIIINDPPYFKSEKAWNALRLATTAIHDDPRLKVRIFLLSDAVYLARKNHSPSPDWPNLEEMAGELISRGVNISVCATCVKSRSFEPDEEGYGSCFIGSREGAMSAADL